MGRVRELGSLDDIVEISAALHWVRPVIDFAHMHATSDGAFTSVEPFVGALGKADAVLAPGRAVSHPLLRHPVREPQRDEAPAVWRRDAAGRAAHEALGGVRAAGDDDLGGADAGVDRADEGDSRRVARSAVDARSEDLQGVRRSWDLSVRARRGRARTPSAGRTSTSSSRSDRGRPRHAPVAPRRWRQRCARAQPTGRRGRRHRDGRHRDGVFRRRRAWASTAGSPSPRRTTRSSTRA